MYRELREAGAHRYLLRIESSNPDLYAKLHPADHSWHRRVECLHELKDLGYQVPQKAGNNAEHLLTHLRRWVRA
jgi:biotin synthase-like enzyme